MMTTSGKLSISIRGKSVNTIDRLEALLEDGLRTYKFHTVDHSRHENDLSRYSGPEGRMQASHPYEVFKAITKPGHPIKQFLSAVPGSQTFQSPYRVTARLTHEHARNLRPDETLHVWKGQRQVVIFPEREG